MLPDEDIVRRDLRRSFGSEFKQMERVLRTVTTLIGGGKLQIAKPRGLNPMVVYMIVGLLTKAAKTSRAIQLCCETGLGQDASVLNRRLFETCAAVAFILRRTPRLRAGMYAAHSLHRQLAMLESWRRTKGLKRKAKKRTLARVRQAIAGWDTTIGPAVNRSVKKHWSGHNIEWTARYLGWDPAYQLFYRFSSPSVHTGDVSQYLDITQDEDVTVKLAPTDKLIQACLATASGMLWQATRTFNNRLGLTLFPFWVYPETWATDHSEI